ncbi:Dabb family protein [Ochrobactrum sp. CM-21-5]|nr:Dabb family protein [Ochrobactrum sp. CM-21-5]MBC2883866.1 Dabb family protein [Ochrobactrum sp. CM-21-5]
MQIPTLTYAGTARENLDREQQKVGPSIFTSHNYKPGTIQHIVLFRFKETVTPAQIKEVKKRFLALKSQAKRRGKPYIAGLEAGAQNSGEGVDSGFQQGFIVTFRSEGDRNYYVGSPVVTNARFYDPAHQRFKDFVGPLLAEKNGVLVFDFRS